VPGMNLTRAEATARAELVTVNSYDIALDLSTGPTTFRTSSTVHFDAADPGSATFIDFVGDSVQSITLNGRSLDPGEHVADHRIALPGLAAHNELVVVATGCYMNTGEGLHRFVDPADDEVYLYTQFEVADSRRVYAVFEQPDLKAAFAFTVTAPAAWRLVSNSPTPEPATGGEVDGIPISTWSFPPTPRLPSYVTALVAGPYDVVRDVVQARDRVVPLAIYSRRSLTKFVDHEAIFDCTKRGFAFFENEFGLAYPFEKYDQVFAPEYNSGAMENAGCVTIAEVYVFRSKVNDALVERRALTILHELAHMWFGDLVTMRWWNDLWLNESFAEWAASVCQSEATKWDHAWTTFASHEKTWAYQQDQLPSTHPVVAPINDLEDVEVNFDGITYAKGGSILKQLVAYVGREAFVEGLRAYFAKHAWGNTTLADLLDELEAGSGRDLAGWSGKWLETAGVNTLEVELTTDADDTIASAAVLQSATGTYPTLRPHRVAIGLYELAGGRLVRTALHELDVDGARTELPELVGRRRPDLVLPNDEDLGYARIRLDERSRATVLAHPGAFTDSLPRVLVTGAMWELVSDGGLAARELVGFLLACIPDERNSTVLRTILQTTKQIPSMLMAAITRFTAPEHRTETVTKVAGVLRALAEAAEPGSDAQFQLVAAFATVAQSPRDVARVRAAFNASEPYDGLTMDQDLRWALLTSLSAAADADEAEIEAELSLDRTATGREQAFLARAARPTPEAKAEAWRLAIEEGEQPNSVIEALGRGFNRANDPQALLGGYIGRYHDMLLPIWQSRSAAIRERVVTYFYPLGLAGPELLAATQGWLAANPSAPAGLRRLVGENLAKVQVAVRAQACDATGG